MKRRPVPIHETGYICASLAMVSGFLETYTYLLKGGVFANAQTGNFALLGMAIAHGDVKKVFTYLIPMCCYVVGIAMTVTVPRQQSAPAGAAFSGLSAHQGAPEPKEQPYLYDDQRILFAGGSERYPVRPLAGRSGRVGVLRRSGAGVAVADLWQAGGRERTAGRGAAGVGRGRTRFGRRAAGIAGRG